ncbi:MAG: hypothetical protein R6V12_11515 [Candidatus Hydrogenedentota bacterium]
MRKAKTILAGMLTACIAGAVILGCDNKSQEPLPYEPQTQQEEPLQPGQEREMPEQPQQQESPAYPSPGTGQTGQQGGGAELP